MILQPADIVCTRSKSKLGGLIRFFTRRIGEPRTKVNHVGIIAVGGTSTNAIIVEALKRVRREWFASAYGGKSAPDVAIFRPLNLTEDERYIVAAKAETYAGRGYGYLKILAHMGDWILQGAYVFRRLVGSDKYPICSWLVAHAYSFIGKTFGVDAGAASPDDIWDFCIANPDKYAVIMPLGNLDEFRRSHI